MEELDAECRLMADDIGSRLRRMIAQMEHKVAVGEGGPDASERHQVALDVFRGVLDNMENGPRGLPTTDMGPILERLLDSRKKG